MSESAQRAKEPQVRGEAVRTRLIDAAEALILERDALQLTAEDVLASAGVSRATLYRHFADVGALIEAALLKGFARQVEIDTQSIAGSIATCNTKEEFRAAMAAITRATNNKDRAPRRFLRAQLIAMAGSRPALKAQLAEVQTNMTDSLASTFEDAKKKGFIKKSVSPRMGALFIQSYTLGRVLLDIEPCSDRDALDWMELIDTVMVSVFTN